MISGFLLTLFKKSLFKKFELKKLMKNIRLQFKPKMKMFLKNHRGIKKNVGRSS